jgi:hypothetical protein
MKIRNIHKRIAGRLMIIVGIVIILAATGLALAQGEVKDTFLPLAMREGQFATPVPTEPTPTPTPTATPTGTPLGDYVVIGWNDLGMHCYDRDYADISVLPPYNNIWAQVILRGDPPQVITEGITLTYRVQDNTYSVGKTNFWSYASSLFGQTLPPNIGLTGKGLSGTMDLVGNHFVAEGVPVTEFRDSAPSTPYYFQLADLTVKDIPTNTVLDMTTIVVPVSSEMRCDTCHDEPFTNYRWNILSLHDEEEGTSLMDQRPVLCASCHADPVLGLPGQAGVPSFSSAMHSKHAEEGVGGNCYACHPGPNTLCLRDVMSQAPNNLWCTDCHGSMAEVGNPLRTPWFTEPQCGNCHDSQFAENPDTLYRRSTGHGGIYCEACHNSTHAILPSREVNDNLQSIELQGVAGSLGKCTICHLTEPINGGPHTAP